jgi:hypothetical protein
MVAGALGGLQYEGISSRSACDLQVADFLDPCWHDDAACDLLVAWGSMYDRVQDIESLRNAGYQVEV